jgi:hypothetical protein
MAYITPYTFIALQALTASQMNGIQDNIRALWPYTTAGDISYASAANTLARLAKGSKGNALVGDGSIPMWNTNYGICARVSRSTEQSINTSSETYISFENESLDTDGIFSSGAPTQLTIQTAGIYLYGCTTCFISASGTIKMWLEAAYSYVDSRPSTPDGFSNLSITGFGYLAASQTIKAKVWHNTGSAIDLFGIFCSMWAIKIP